MLTNTQMGMISCPICHWYSHCMTNLQICSRLNSRFRQDSRLAWNCCCCCNYDLTMTNRDTSWVVHRILCTDFDSHRSFSALYWTRSLLRGSVCLVSHKSPVFHSTFASLLFALGRHLLAYYSTRNNLLIPLWQYHLTFVIELGVMYTRCAGFVLNFANFLVLMIFPKQSKNQKLDGRNPLITAQTLNNSQIYLWSRFRFAFKSLRLLAFDGVFFSSPDIPF